MKRFFTSVLACLCVLAAMAENFYDRNVKTQFERSDVKVSTSVDALWNKYNDGRGPVTRRVSTQSGYSYLGMGTYTDNFFGGTANVEIWQSNSNSTYYRVVKPYDGITNATGSSYTGADYLDLIVMQPGATLGDITITKSDLVLFDGIYTGEHNSTYDADVWIYHPFMFTSLHEESYWTYNKVLSYQDSGIPSQIQLAPYYYMDGVGGWNNTQYNGVVTIKFPGVELPDPYHSSVTCTNSNPSSLTTSDVLQLKAVYGNNGAAGNVTTVPVIFSADGNLTLVKAGDQRSDYFSTSQTTVSYSMALTGVSEGSYYATTMFYDENEAGWFYNSKYFVDITIVPDKILVQSITLSKTSATLTSGSTLQLEATVLPTNATNKTVSWTTSNSNVATVSSSGLVTAKTVTTQSTATITCSATDGSGVKATCTVTVTPSVIPVQSITLSQTSASLSVGGTLQLSATVLPTNATNKTVSWTTSSSSVATVSSAGLITAVASGTATITCSATDGSGVKATCSVTVSGGYPEPSISAVTCENSSLTQNDELKMTATFYNYGVGGNVRTVPVVMAKDDDLTLIEVGDIVSNYFPASQSTPLSYSLSMADVPDGEYYASVLFYIESDDEDEEGWYYSSKCLVEITVGGGDNLKGDVNGDYSVNGTDLVALTNIILGRSATKPAADVNQDGSVNGTDYVVLANIILGRSNARGMGHPTAAGDFAGTSWIEVEPYEISTGQEKEVTIDLFNPDDEITLVQFDLDLPQGLSLKVVDGDYDIDIAGRTTWKNHSLSANATDGIIRFLLASSNNKALSGTEGAIINMTLVADDSYLGEGISLKNILLVTPDEKETKPEDIVPVGIRGIVASTEQSHAPIYSISGQRLATPQKGLNIVGGKKLLVK